MTRSRDRLAELDAAIGELAGGMPGTAPTVNDPAGTPSPAATRAARPQPSRDRSGLVPIGEQVRAVAESAAQRLAALEAEMARAVAEGRQVVEVDPVAIRDSAWRDRFEETAVDPDLAALEASIRAAGQLMPVGLRPIGPSSAGAPAAAYEIVYGHRRVRAVRGIGDGRKVRAVILPADDRELVRAMLLENAARKDLSAIERGTAYRRILDAGLYQRHELARLLSVTPQQVSNLARLAELPGEVLELLGDPRTLSINEGHRLLAALQATGGAVPLDLADAIRAAPGNASTRARLLARRLVTRDVQPTEPGIVLRARDGRRLGRLTRSGRQMVIRFQADLDPDRVTRLARRLTSLWDELQAPPQDDPSD